MLGVDASTSTTSLNAISPPIALPGAIERNAISHWGFSWSPHAPEQKRAESSG